MADPEPPLDRALAYLKDRNALLVLDNMEQVTDARTTVSRLLAECPKISIVVTSRIPLQIRGEQEFPVPALSLPSGTSPDSSEAASSEAVRLFVERAMAARPDFNLTDENAPAIAEIVHKLDGLPLAIELAAARIRTLPVEALRRRLGDRLGLLTGGARDLPERQQTLRGAIEWSHDLLDDPDRRLFARFSVIAGGALFDQTEQVCGPADEIGREVFDGLDSLSAAEPPAGRRGEWGAALRDAGDDPRVRRRAPRGPGRRRDDASPTCRHVPRAGRGGPAARVGARCRAVERSARAGA